MNKRQKKEIIQTGHRKKSTEENEIFREKLSPGDKQTMGRKKADSKCFLGQQRIKAGSRKNIKDICRSRRKRTESN